MSSVTRIWPSHWAEAPMPMVGADTAAVISGASVASTPSTTMAKAPAASAALASAKCDGQILVTDDLLGLFEWTPKFVRRYADLKGIIDKAAGAYAADVRARRFPAAAETYVLGGKPQRRRVAGDGKRG